MQSSSQNSTGALRQRIEELEEECRQLREMLVPVVTFDPKLKLGHQQRQILSILVKASPKIISAERIFTLAYELNSDVNAAIIGVHIYNIRKNCVRLELKL